MKKRLYNGRGKVKKSIWYQDLSKIKSVRLEHMELMALPPKRRLPRRHKKKPDVSRGALRSRASQRTIALSQSRSNLYERLAKEQIELDKFCHFRVSRGARSANASERVKSLAIPKIRYMIEAKEFFKSSPKRIKKIDKRIKKAEQLWGPSYPRHIHSGITVVPSVTEKKKKGFLEQKSEKKKRAEAQQKVMEEHFARIASLSVPKKVFPPRRGRKRKWRPLPELLPRILKLIKIPLSDLEKPVRKDPFKTSRAALKYKPSERIKEICKPKTFEEPKPFETPYDYMMPHKGGPCEKCLKLAVPKVRQMKADDTINEFAFKVHPLALVAWCSPRTKKLAKPRKKFT